MNKNFTRRTAIRIAVAGTAAAAAGAVRATGQGSGDMERVEGIGGFFFRAKDPKKLAAWYADNLGVTAPVWRTTAGTTALAPFKEDTKYFGDARNQWMINFRVRDLDKMMAQLRGRGVAVVVEADDATGRFARLSDPEGNPIQLWQPAGKDRG